MNKIYTLKNIRRIIEKEKNAGKKIVLVGGCFDIVHYAHLKFLQKAKTCGDIIVVALESNASVKKLKGNSRPINTQKTRAQILAAFEMVDYVLLLPVLKNYQDYLKMVEIIKPNVIAVTKKDSRIEEKKRQAKIIGAIVKEVIKPIGDFSTSKVARILQNETL